MILDRQQFRSRNEILAQQITESGAPVWIPDNHPNQQCQWFVGMPCTDPDSGNWSIMRSWIQDNMRGCVFNLGRSPGAQQEWWGFTVYDDISIFLLRWS